MYKIHGILKTKNLKTFSLTICMHPMNPWLRHGFVLRLLTKKSMVLIIFIPKILSNLCNCDYLPVASLFAK